MATRYNYGDEKKRFLDLLDAIEKARNLNDPSKSDTPHSNQNGDKKNSKNNISLQWAILDDTEGPNADENSD